MNWYKGGIAAAVSEAKLKNAIFVVYVEGTDDLSQAMSLLINDTKIIQQLSSPEFIVIRIESGSQAYTQFAQIYQLVPLPSLFFIGKNGTPIEVVTSMTKTVIELEEKIAGALAKEGLTASPPPTAYVNTELGGAQSAPSSSTAAAAEPISASNAAPVECENGVCKIPVVDEKLERAKAVLAQQRKMKEAEEAAKEKERELQRRRDGQDLKNFKRMQEEEEMKNLREEKLRERNEEKEARKRILDQIAQDKIERAQRFGQATPTPSPTEKTNTIPIKINTPKLENNEFARIQFKKPNGESEMHLFNSSDKFSTLRSYVEANVMIGTSPHNYCLATTFPRREFASTNDEQTLLQLGLSPTAVILIVPLTKPSVVSSVLPTSSTGLFDMASKVFFILVAPILSIYGYVKGIVLGTKNTGANKRNNEGSTSDNDAAKRRNLRFPNEARSADTEPSTSRGTGAYKRTGNSNIHRLHDNNDSEDDDNNTWNGNSTQQM